MGPTARGEVVVAIDQGFEEDIVEEKYECQKTGCIIRDTVSPIVI